MSDTPYRVDKLAAHPKVLEALRSGHGETLTTVHLMPQNLCNQSCEFCSYRLPENKNSAAFDESKHIPWPAMESLLDDFVAMGVKGVEVTGGGEPLAYPRTLDLWAALASRAFATALVTNGTLIKDLAPLISQRLKWARVSIDASTPKTYAQTRLCPEAHFEKAWRAVRELRAHAPSDPEYRLGVGFVLSNTNIDDVYEFVHLAKENGAHNVRLSVTFSDQNKSYYTDHAAVREAIDESVRAWQDFDDDSFQVVNLIPMRWGESLAPEQDYVRCPTKEVLCVVEGECKVYTCCTFTGSLKGLYGKFTEHEGGFQGLWRESRAWRANLDASKYCDVACLYRDRNLAMNALIDSGFTPDDPDVLHREFI